MRIAYAYRTLFQHRIAHQCSSRRLKPLVIHLFYVLSSTIDTRARRCSRNTARTLCCRECRDDLPVHVFKKHRWNAYDRHKMLYSQQASAHQWLMHTKRNANTIAIHLGVSKPIQILHAIYSQYKCSWRGAAALEENRNNEIDCVSRCSVFGSYALISRAPDNCMHSILFRIVFACADRTVIIAQFRNDKLGIVQ